MRTMSLRLVFRLLFAALMLAAALPVAATLQEPEEGFDYEIFERAAGLPEVPGKITVIESFWYQCPQCNQLLPLIEYWARRDEARVNFVRIPLALRPGFGDQEILYYTLEELGETERLHEKIFEAIHFDHVPMKTLEDMAEFLEWHDIPAERFLATARSPAVRARYEASRKLLAHYGIKSVPILVVDGRYLTSAVKIGGTHADSLIMTEQLIRMVERERALQARGTGK